MIAALAPTATVIKAGDVDIPATDAHVVAVDFKQRKIRPPDRALGALAIMAAADGVISTQMLEAALRIRFTGEVLENALALVKAAV
jgi:hypothetical protein